MAGEKALLLGSGQPNATIQSAYSAYIRHHEVGPRRGQKHMIADIARYLGGVTTHADGSRSSEDSVCTVEAGTGTGKTLAYLMAALPYAFHHEKKLVIAAATVTQQQQILTGDLPKLCAATKWPLQAELARGRGRFLCVSKLDALLAGEAGLFPSSSQNDLAGSESIIEGFDRTHYESLLQRFSSRAWAGDIDSLDLDLPTGLWPTVTTDNRACLNRDCDFFSSCPYFRQRAQIDSADIIIANQDLLLADLNLGGGVVLPPMKDCILVIDEAHQLSDKALGHFSAFAGLGSSQQTLAELKSRAEGAEHLRLSEESMAEQLKRCADLAETMGGQIKALWEWHQDAAEWEQAQDLQSVMHRYQAGDCPSALRSAAVDLAESASGLVEALNKIGETIARQLENDSSKDADSQHMLQAEALEFGGYLGSIETLKRLFEQTSKAGADAAQPPVAVWWTRLGEDSGDLVLHASPTHGGSYLQSMLWQNVFAAICTSATMSSGQAAGQRGSDAGDESRFRRFSNTVGLPAASVFSMHDSPFDYANNCQLRIMRSRQRPGDSAAYIEELSLAIASLIDFSEATLVIFSSRKQFSAVSARLEQLLSAAQQKTLLSQLISQPSQLIQTHRERVAARQGSVLLGMASFAEGLDLPGALLTQLIICKLPFAVPDDPVESTYSEWLEARGGRPFNEVSLPDAIIRFRQAFGRLIRTERDKGTVTVLDSRLISKSYGRQFIEALPRCRMEQFDAPKS